MLLSTNGLSFHTAVRLAAVILAFFAWPTLVLAAGGRQIYVPATSQLPPLLYKCRSADGSRDFPVAEVRRLPEDQNVYWATMRTLGLSREGAKALNVQCELAQKPMKGNYGCRALITFRGDPGEILMPANSVEEARGFSVNKLGDGPIRCRGLKEGETVDNTKPPANPLDGPFSRITMGDYFNAIYNGEPEVVRYLDKKSLGKIVTNISGGFGDNPIWRKFVEAMQLDKATLAMVALREYAQQYEKVYGQCLRKDAASFTISQTTRRDGIIVSQVDTRYRVNREFAAVVDAAGVTKDTIGDALGDMAYGSPLAQTKSGIDEIMSTFRCDDPVIKQFEAGLLSVLGFAPQLGKK